MKTLISIECSEKLAEDYTNSVILDSHHDYYEETLRTKAKFQSGIMAANAKYISEVVPVIDNSQTCIASLLHALNNVLSSKPVRNIDETIAFAESTLSQLTELLKP